MQAWLGGERGGDQRCLGRQHRVQESRGRGDLVQSQPLLGARQQAERRRQWDWPLCHEPRVGVLLAVTLCLCTVSAAPRRAKPSSNAAQGRQPMAAPTCTSWREWLAGLWNSLRGPPDPGTPEARLEELRVGALLNKEH